MDEMGPAFDKISKVWNFSLKNNLKIIFALDYIAKQDFLLRFLLKFCLILFFPKKLFRFQKKI